MNKLDFNNKEFRKEILNNIKNKENLDQELLNKIVESEVGELAGRIANEYNVATNIQNKVDIINKYCTKHIVTFKDDYKYLNLDNDKTLVRINKVNILNGRFDILLYDFKIVDGYVTYEKIYIKHYGGSIHEKFKGINEINEEDMDLWEALEDHIYNS